MWRYSCVGQLSLSLLATDVSMVESGERLSGDCCSLMDCEGEQKSTVRLVATRRRPTVHQSVQSNTSGVATRLCLKPEPSCSDLIFSRLVDELRARGSSVVSRKFKIFITNEKKIKVYLEKRLVYGFSFFQTEVISGLISKASVTRECSVCLIFSSVFWWELQCVVEGPASPFSPSPRDKLKGDAGGFTHADFLQEPHEPGGRHHADLAHERLGDGHAPLLLAAALRIRLREDERE